MLCSVCKEEKVKKRKDLGIFGDLCPRCRYDTAYVLGEVFHEGSITHLGETYVFTDEGREMARKLFRI